MNQLSRKSKCTGAGNGKRTVTEQLLQQLCLTRNKNNSSRRVYGKVSALSSQEDKII